MLKKCSKCQLSKPVSDFSKNKSRKDGLHTVCRICHSEHYQANKDYILQRSSDYYEANRDKRLIQMRSTYHTARGRVKAWLKNAKQKSEAKGWQFDLEEAWLMDLLMQSSVCPLLGIPLVMQPGKGRQPDSPSLDRIDSSRGYTKNNVWIISTRANTIKNDATVEELELIAKSLRSKLNVCYPVVTPKQTELNQ